MRKFEILTIAALSSVALFTAACSKSEPKAAATTTPPPAAAPKAEIPPQTPKEWMVVDETDFIPVVDDLTDKLSAARKAFVAKDWKGSATGLSTAADLLDKEEAGSARPDKANLTAASKSLRDLAKSLEGGKAPTAKALDAALAKAHRADLERDWLVEDIATWYPFVDEPNTHFQAAHEAFVSKAYKKSAEEIRKGAAFVRKEAGSAVSTTKSALTATDHDLDRLANSVDKGYVKDVKALDNAFARANHALALSHQIKANEAWDKHEAGKVEHELKAGAKYLENAAAWAGDEAKAAAADVVRDSRSAASKLAEGSGSAVEDAGKRIADLGKAIADLGQKTPPSKE